MRGGRTVKSRNVCCGALLGAVSISDKARKKHSSEGFVYIRPPLALSKRGEKHARFYVCGKAAEG